VDWLQDGEEESRGPGLPAAADAIQKASDAALDECGKTGNSCRIFGAVNADGAGR
jgi:hypothetical protein